MIKDELGGKIMKKCLGLRAKTYSYLRDDGSEDKKAKETKKFIIKKILKFENQNQIRIRLFRSKSASK